MLDKEKFQKLVQLLEASESNADAELAEVFLAILQSELDDGQKRLLLYFLHAALLTEVKREIATRKIFEEKIDKNPMYKYKQAKQKIVKLATKFEKIRDKIGEILYNAVVTADSSEKQKNAYTERFKSHNAWINESSAARKVMNDWRGFKVCRKKE